MITVVLSSEGHRRQALQAVQDAAIGYEVTICRRRKKKTHPQLAYCFGVVYQTIRRFVRDSYGEAFSVEEIHRWMKKQVLGPAFKQIGDELIEVEIELRKEDRAAWAEYIDSVIAYCWDRWALTIPEAGDGWHVE